MNPDGFTDSTLFSRALRQSYRQPTWARAKGTYIWTADGQRLLDCTSGFGVCTFGYSHPKVVEAVSKQMRLLPHAISSIYPHLYEHEALSAVARHAPIADPAVILTSSGSESVEVALKIASLWTQRDGIAYFDGAYHGQSLGSLRVSGQSALREPFEGLIPQNALRIPFPTSAEKVILPGTRKSKRLMNCPG